MTLTLLPVIAWIKNQVGAHKELYREAITMSGRQWMFLAALITGIIWFLQLKEIVKLEAKIAEHNQRVDMINNPLSTQNMGRYLRAVVSGFTFGASSGGNMLAEIEKYDNDKNFLTTEGDFLNARMSSAIKIRNWSWFITLFFLFGAFYITSPKNGINQTAGAENSPMPAPPEKTRTNPLLIAIMLVLTGAMVWVMLALYR